MDAVSEVLIGRSAKSDGLTSMVAWSAMAHLVLVATVAFVPGAWFGALEQEPEVVMQISLGGPIGPADGGLATLGGRTIQQVVETKKAVEQVRPPAAQTPAMIEPSTATISNSGGTSAITTRRGSEAFCAASSTSAGAVCGRKNARPPTQSM